MTIKVAINGFGRIGRNILRAYYERGDHGIKIVAINDLGPIETNAHLLRYDSTHGTFPGTVEIDKQDLIVNGDRIHFCSERDAKQLPWHHHDVDVVFECTGHYASREKAQAHLEAGAKKVIISAPAGKTIDATIVYGVNHQILTAQHKIISNASCTTNCLAPLVQPLHKAVGIQKGLMNTVHAYTNDQVLVDSSHSDLRRARSATQSMIPTKTGAAAAVGLVLPELDGRLDGFSIRVPTINVSVVDLTFIAERDTSVDEINELLANAAASTLKGVLAVNEAPLVSCDFNHHPASSIADLTQTKVIGNLVKVIAWYDNEWGFSNRMLDVAQSWA
jgi:glyceraldehyde 3-phosphate dehydrogenase (phosphorylating)